MTRIHEALTSRGRRMFAAGTLLVVFGMFAACTSSPQAKEAKYLRRGESYLTKKDYWRALLEFKNASAAMPKDAEPHYQMGLAYLALGNLPNGAVAFHEATELNPKHELAQLKLGELMVTRGDKDAVQQGTKRLQGVLSASPNNSDANDALALAEWKLGKTDEADARLAATLQKFPSRLRTSVELAQFKLRQKDLTGAEQVLKQAVAKAPQSSLAEVALGQLYMVTNQPVQSEAEFRKAIQLDSNSGLALMGLAAIQLAGKRMTEADETYRKLAALPGAEFKPLHALFLFRQGKRDAALAEFEKLVKKDPNDRAARNRLFTAYVAMKKDRAALKLAAESLKKNPNDTDILFQRAGLYLRSGNIVGAENDVTAVLHFNPGFAEGHALMAAIDKAKGQPLEERHEWDESLRINPALIRSRVALAQNFTQAQQWKAALDVLNGTPPNQRGMLAVVVARNWALLAAGETKELRSALDQALRVRRFSELVIQDGLLRIQEADYSGAITDAEEAIKNNDMRGVRLLAIAYTAQKQPAKAEARLEELVAAHPHSAPLDNLLGVSYLNAGNLSGARKEFEAALAADPKSADAGLALAGIDIHEKHSDLARQRLLGMLTANPNNVAALLMLGEVAGELGDSEEALRRYRAVIALDSSNVVALNNLACTLASSQPDEALKYAQQAAELAPDSAMVADTLGWIYYKKTIYGTATTYLQTAVAREPTPRRQFHLAMSYMKQGQLALAGKIMELALRQDPNLPVTEKEW